jgi:hypothetical protein
MRAARTQMQLVPLAHGSVTLSGTVLTDTAGRPIGGADVSIRDLEQSVVTNELGMFRISDVPVGSHRVLVRHVGFSPIEVDLTLSAGRQPERKFLLARAIVLDSVRVTATAMDRTMMSFEDHRRTGLGHFLTRADLQRVEDMPPSEILESLIGVRLVRGRGTQAWVVSSRGAQSINRTYPSGDAADRAAGARPSCYARIYLDNTLVYRGRVDEPLFDISRIHPDELEGIEYYSGPAQTPGEYSTLDATCGVLVLWRRR